eukprot:CAMPEP_0174750958 /NCGR_PEP_ID=MMETSP1094-20130205/98835_1 /TAXON_ID=156173 /ORGANISM="Chrysochromulina brevifilum, Strain UTEX LB 985" /LENGTH=133 /DNA_ID=CAMNT_0015956373 /DNA_START=32 /DNA_END=432 /DNA_ORIENTATION=-
MTDIAHVPITDTLTPCPVLIALCLMPSLTHSSAQQPASDELSVRAHAGEVYSLTSAAVRGLSLLASAGADRKIRLWNIDGGPRPVPADCPWLQPHATLDSSVHNAAVFALAILSAAPQISSAAASTKSSYQSA